jgi:hypothetical protein
VITMRVLILSLGIISALGFTNRAISSASGLETRSCIADLCIYPNELPIKTVIREYGGNENARQVCYQIQENGLCLVVTATDHPDYMTEFVESLEIKKDCNCEVTIEPRKSFPTVLTSEGLGIGDSYRKVIQLYGVPRWIRAKNASEAKKFGLSSKVVQIELLHGHDFVFGYVPDDDSLNALFVYLDGDIVVAIEASVSE